MSEEHNNESVESVFDKLLEGETNHEDNDRGDAVAAAVAAAVAQPTPKPAKKKTVRKSFSMTELILLVRFTSYLYFIFCYAMYVFLGRFQLLDVLKPLFALIICKKIFLFISCSNFSQS